MTEQRAEQPVPETYTYWAEERDKQPITLEEPHRELTGDSVEQRRQVSIDNLRFKIDHAEELELRPRKLERMHRELSSLEFAQEYPDPSLRKWMYLDPNFNPSLIWRSTSFFSLHSIRARRRELGKH